ncbi:hypothetical protein M5K25_000208 [Dendrobium thyrsiflorum]|uniref:Uncharacterized protein n=1 Tax=Dendrobium thyrsiflorum TaxID=117978 RepID=A0ABD0W9N9_DENTH
MAELKKNPILILRFDGEYLKEFLASTQFEPEMINIFSQIGARSSSLRESIMMALEQLTVDHGLPPSSDSWEQPVIVAHTEKTFDGGGIRRLLSNKFELNKLLDLVWRDLPKESNLLSAKQILQVALDRMATSADFPCSGTVDQVDTIVNEIFNLVDEKEISQLEQFKKIMTDILGNLMLQMEGNPISISSNSVVHEPLTSPSTVLPSSSLSSQPEIE